jgi:hypothetical protein
MVLTICRITPERMGSESGDKSNGGVAAKPHPQLHCSSGSYAPRTGTRLSSVSTAAESGLGGRGSGAAWAGARAGAITEGGATTAGANPLRTAAAGKGAGAAAAAAPPPRSCNVCMCAYTHRRRRPSKVSERSRLPRLHNLAPLFAPCVPE